MADSQFRLVRRGLGALVAASLLAGVSLDAAAAGAKGQVRLQLGPQGNPSQFVYIKPDGTASTQVDKFSGSKGSEKCFFTWREPSTLKLIDLAAFAPEGVDARLGVGPDSIGVYNNSSGVSCYRVETRFSEGITFDLGSGLESRVEAATGETINDGSLYFDRLELDVEVKGNAELVLRVHLGSQSTVYTLRSGNRIVVGDGTSGESDPGNTVFNCSANSDSGPDSGPNDNCRWIINDLGRGFTLSTLNGEVSLEGGGDFAPNNYANNTVVYLTTLIESGDLYCNPNISPELDNQTGVVGGGPVASCQTTRINPNNLGQNICPAFPLDVISYDLETFVGDTSKCELRKTNGSMQFAGSIQITFEPETSTDWGSNRTGIAFSCSPNSSDPDCTYDSERDQYITAPYLAPRCEGTVVNDANGNPTILEVLSSGGANFVDDQVDDNGFVDWACVLDHREVYTGTGRMQVIQTILYWGDIKFERF